MGSDLNDTYARINDALRGFNCILFVLWIMDVVALSDYDRQEIADACPGLFAFMLADAVYVLPLLIIVALAVYMLTASGFGLNALIPYIGVSLWLSAFVMYALKIHFISTSWYSDACANATSGRVDPKQYSGGRPLEIVGWVQISVFSLLLPLQAAALALQVMGAKNTRVNIEAQMMPLPSLRVVL